MDLYLISTRYIQISHFRPWHVYGTAELCCCEPRCLIALDARISGEKGDSRRNSIETIRVATNGHNETFMYVYVYIYEHVCIMCI
jgi:hypothetical protein